MTDDLRRRVRRRARYRCEYCQLPQSAVQFRHQVDHIIAEQHEGGDEPSNLALACTHCNLPQGPEPLRPRPGDPGVDPSLQPAARPVARALRLAGGGAHRLDGRRTDDDPGPGDERPVCGRGPGGAHRGRPFPAEMSQPGCPFPSPGSVGSMRGARLIRAIRRASSAGDRCSRRDSHSPGRSGTSGSNSPTPRRRIRPVRGRRRSSSRGC